jgi:CheY-like chemotaxis protein
MDRADQEMWRAKEVARLLSLVEAERRYYQEILAVLPVAVAVLSQDLTFASSNLSFRRLFSIQPHYQSALSITEVPGLQFVAEHASRIFTSAPASAELTAELPDSRLARVTLQPMRDWDLQANPEMLLVVQPLEAAAVPALQDLPGIVWELDPAQMRFASVTPHAVETMRLPVDLWMAGADFLGPRIHEADLQSVSAFYNQPGQDGSVRSCDYRVLDQQGNLRWLRDTVLFSLRLWRGITIDITHSRQSEAFLARCRRLESLSQLAGRVIHDCNNLLMIMGGYGEDLLHALAPADPLRANVQEILTAGDRLTALAHELSTLTMPVARAAHAPIHIDHLLAGLGEQLQTTLPPGIQLIMSLDAHGAIVHLDQNMFSQALLKLAARAIESMGRKGKLTIASRSAEIAGTNAAEPGCPPAGQAVEITIRDSGPAIPQDLLNHVFEEAILPQPARHNLTSVFHAVRDCGGLIAVNSGYGNGASFTITLPSSPAQPAHHTVLLVEDEAGIRSLIRKVLERRGYDIIEASNGHEALSAGPDPREIGLLITDVAMPGMNGVELAASLRQTRPDLPVLFLSGYTGSAMLDPANLPPHSAFLSKPFTIAALQEKVESLLDGDAAAARA